MVLMLPCGAEYVLTTLLVLHGLGPGTDRDLYGKQWYLGRLWCGIGPTMGRTRKEVYGKASKQLDRMRQKPVGLRRQYGTSSRVSWMNSVHSTSREKGFPVGESYRCQDLIRMEGLTYPQG